MTRATRLIMGMPVTIDIVGTGHASLMDEVFDWFNAVDRRFSPYREDSEITAVNQGTHGACALSGQMREILALSEATRKQTAGYFDIRRFDGTLDPSGIVKGWAIAIAARIISGRCVAGFYVDAGGDIQVQGLNQHGDNWTAGIRNPFHPDEIIKAVALDGRGIATSGSYVRGDHIYDPLHPGRRLDEIVSLTVIGPNVFEADRFATAAFAMGRQGIRFIECQPGLEGYAVDSSGRAEWTRGFGSFVLK